MSFANEFRRAQKTIVEEIAYYRTFQALSGMEEPISVLEELRDKWTECEKRSEGRGKLPARPADWDDDEASRQAAKEVMKKIIKAAAVAAASASAEKPAPDERPPGSPLGEA